MSRLDPKPHREPLYHPSKIALVHTLRSYIHSKKQYTTKFKEWGFEKNIEEKDMRAIARKDRKRKADNPLKATTYRLRKGTVPPRRIERYKKDHHITDDTTISEAGMLKRDADFTFANGDTDLATPFDLGYETPHSSVLDGSPIHASPLIPYTTRLAATSLL